MTTKRDGRLFFTTIPKCGKNLIYTFLARLGYARTPDPERDVATHATYLRHFADLDRRATYAFASPGTREEAAQAMDGLLERLAGMPAASSYQGHFVFDARLHARLLDLRIPVAFVYRDPRDCLLSMANYVLNQQYPVHLARRAGDLGLEDLLRLLLAGDDRLVPFAGYFDAFAGWREAEGVLALRFEDLVGPRGGGSASAQQDAFRRLADHMGWQGGEDALQAAVSSAFSTEAGTFFRGQIGAWREAFGPALRSEFERSAGALVARWGYAGDAAAATRG